jgi:hypothetical protein
MLYVPRNNNYSFVCNQENSKIFRLLQWKMVKQRIELHLEDELKHVAYPSPAAWALLLVEMGMKVDPV